MLKNIRVLREEKGISQRQLAEAIGVSQQSVNKYENHNIEPDIETLIAIADFFHTSIDYVVGHTDIRNKIEQVSSYDLNDAESTMLSNYRKLTETQQRGIDAVIRNYNE